MFSMLQLGSHKTLKLFQNSLKARAIHSAGTALRTGFFAYSLKFMLNMMGNAHQSSIKRKNTIILFLSIFSVVLQFLAYCITTSN